MARYDVQELAKKLFKLQLMQNMQYEKTLSQSSKLKELSHIEISDCRTFHKLDNSPLYSIDELSFSVFRYSDVSFVLGFTWI